MTYSVTNGYATKTATVSDSPVAISDFGWDAGDLEAADRAAISAHTAGIVMTWDGTTPDPTTGMPVSSGMTVEIKGRGGVQASKFIRSGAVDSVVSITLEKF